jgi:hypothetical protein
MGEPFGVQNSRDSLLWECEIQILHKTIKDSDKKALQKTKKDIVIYYIVPEDVRKHSTEQVFSKSHTYVPTKHAKHDACNIKLDCELWNATREPHLRTEGETIV